jgi:hypothetical protein
MDPGLVTAAVGVVGQPGIAAQVPLEHEDMMAPHRDRARRTPAARFILVGLYSARREETIRRTQWLPTVTHPWMNLDAWIYQGRGAEERKTKKRRPPAKIANRLRARAPTLNRYDCNPILARQSRRRNGRPRNSGVNVCGTHPAASPERRRSPFRKRRGSWAHGMSAAKHRETSEP